MMEPLVDVFELRFCTVGSTNPTALCFPSTSQSNYLFRRPSLKHDLDLRLRPSARQRWYYSFDSKLKANGYQIYSLGTNCDKTIHMYSFCSCKTVVNIFKLRNLSAIFYQPRHPHNLMKISTRLSRNPNTNENIIEQDLPKYSPKFSHVLLGSTFRGNLRSGIHITSL